MIGDNLVSILQRSIDLDRAALPPAAAEALLLLGLCESEQARMSELAAKSNSGTLTPQDAEEYDSYIAAADLISLWKAKARLALKQQPSAA